MVGKILVSGVPNDTTPVDVTLSAGAASLLSSRLYAVGGLIEVNGLQELINAFFAGSTVKTATLMASAQYVSSGSTVTKSASIIVYQCKTPIGASSCAAFLATHFFTANQIRIVPRGFASLNFDFYDEGQTPIVASLHYVYEDGTTYDYTAQPAMATPGINHNPLDYDTIVSFQQSDKKICSVVLRFNSIRTTLYISDDKLTDIAYHNIFGYIDHLFVKTYRVETIDREFQKTRMDDETTSIYDVRTTDKMELTLNLVSHSQLDIVREIIMTGTITMEGRNYIIIDHTWQRTDIPGEGNAITLTLEPTSIVTEIQVPDGGIFSIQYNEVYD